MDQQQLQEKLTTLKGDILLAERALNKLRSEIEQFNSSKETALKEYNSQIKLKKEEIEAIAAKGKQTQLLVHAYSESLEAIVTDLTKAKKQYMDELQKATEAVASVHGKAKIRENAVKDRERAVVLREQTVQEQEEIIGHQIEGLIERKDAIQKEEEKLSHRVKVIVEQEQKSKETLEANKILLDDIKSDIIQAEEQLKTLNKKIEDKKAEELALLPKAEETLQEARSLEKVTNERNRLLNEKDKELRNKEIWLDDREETLARSYREVIQRRGSIDG